MLKKKSYMAFMASFALLHAPNAYADCTSPSGVEGSIVYNADDNVPQVCAYQTWMALGPLNPTAPATGCSSPVRDEGEIIYNDDFNIMQYCDGSSWIAINVSPYDQTAISDNEVDNMSFELDYHDVDNLLGITSNVESSCEEVVGANQPVNISVNEGDDPNLYGGNPQYCISSATPCFCDVQGWTTTAGTVEPGEHVKVRVQSTANGTTRRAMLILGSDHMTFDVSNKIVCSAMNTAYGFGRFRSAIWLMQSKNLPPEYEIGYHVMAGPMIAYAYSGNNFGRRCVRGFMEHMARHRTRDLWLSRRGKMDIIGRAERMIIEPISYTIGFFVRKLNAEDAVKQRTDHYMKQVISLPHPKSAHINVPLRDIADYAVI